MEQFTIQTAQNIGIEQPLASIAERILATFIDFAIIGAYLIVMFGIAGLTNDYVIMFLVMLPVLFYHLFFEFTMNGQSPGKRALSIKVVSENGAIVSFTSIFIRWVFRLIDIATMFGSIATLFIVFSEKNQRLGDIVGKTILIRTKQQKNDKSIYYELQENYSVQFPEVEKLSEEDIKTLNEVLAFLRNTSRNDESKLFASKTKALLEKKMGIDAKYPPEAFLITLKKDYNFLQRQNN